MTTISERLVARAKADPGQTAGEMLLFVGCLAATATYTNSFAAFIAVFCGLGLIDLAADKVVKEIKELRSELKK